MIKVDNDYNIIYSHGDTFAVKFELDDEYVWTDGCKAIFSISNGDELLLDATVDSPIGEKNNILLFTIPAEEMEKLPIARLNYDLHIEYPNGEKFTADFIRQLILVPTAH